MIRAVALLLVVGAFAVGLVAAGQLGIGPVVVTREGEQKIIILLGDPRRVTEAGLSLRWPLVETAETYDSRWLYLDTEKLPIQTKDGEYLTVDNYAIWRIDDAVSFRRSFPVGMAQAENRIDRAVRDDVREVIGRHTLEETLMGRRQEIMQEITEKTRNTLRQYGLEVADVRINRTELPEGTEDSVYARMKTERERLARKSRAEGEELARRIRAEADRESRVIVAEGRREAEILRGRGEAEATRIYAEAYGQAPEFYDFLRSLEAYRKSIDDKTTLVLSPKAEFFRFLESPDLSGPAAPGEP